MNARRLLMWAGLAVGVFVVGLIAGVVFGQAAPDVAARQVVREFVRVEQVTLDVIGEEAVAPTSGGNDGAPACGLQRDLAIDDVVASLDAGLVVVHVRTEPLAEQAADELADVDPAAWAVTIDERLDEDVVATSWGVRMALSDVDGQLLRAFVAGHSGRRDELPDCPAA